MSDFINPFTLYLPNIQPIHGEVTFSAKDPHFKEINQAVRKNLPLKSGEFERVRVWIPSRYTDMFVDEMGAIIGLHVNLPASQVYWNNIQKHDPNWRDRDLPHIYGPALVFDHQIWN